MTPICQLHHAVDDLLGLLALPFELDLSLSVSFCDLEGTEM